MSELTERLERLAALGDEAAGYELRQQQQRREPVAQLLGPLGGAGVSRYGNGNGDGYGNGYGYGDGDGDADGDGTGDGNGYGNGYSYGNGYGTGYGTGYGYGDGNGNGDGYRVIVKPEEKGMEGGELCVVVGAYGWVYVGYVADVGLRAHLIKGAVVERWGTRAEGLGQLALDGPQPETRLRREPPCSWPIYGAEVRRIPVCSGAVEAWERALSALWAGREEVFSG